MEEELYSFSKEKKSKEDYSKKQTILFFSIVDFFLMFDIFETKTNIIVTI